MPEHNTLDGADQHSAKSTNFTGDPTAYTPTESGILVVRTDVTPNVLYRTTGTTLGAVTRVGAAEGTAATVDVDGVTTTTLPAGQDATVVVNNTGTINAATFDFDFSIPAGASSTTTTTVAFTQPAEAASVSASVASTSGFAANQIVFIDAGAGSYYQIESITDATTLSVTNLAGYGNVAAGQTIASGSNVVPGGRQGPAGTNGTNGTDGADGATGPQGPAGADGTNGTNGTNGVDGADGVSGFGLRFTYSTSTTSGPASGELRFNNAAPGSATAIYVSETDRNSNGLASTLNAISDGSTIQVLDENDATASYYFSLASQVDNGTDRTLTVTSLGGSGTLTGDLSLAFAPKGDVGSTGAVSSASALTLDEQASSPSTGVDEIALYNLLGLPKIRLESDGAILSPATLEVAQAFTAAQRSTPSAIAISSGAITIDASERNIYTLSLTENVTSISISNLSAGSTFDVHVTQDATGGRTVAGWPAAVVWPGGTAPTISSAANAADLISFQSPDGTSVKAVFSQDFS